MLQDLSRHSLVYGVAEQLGRVGGLVLTPFLTSSPPRGLTRGEFGTRELIAISLIWLTQLAGANVSTSLTRFYFEKQGAERRLVASTILLFVSGVALSLGLVLFLCAPALAALLPSDVPGLAHLVRLALGIFCFQMVREAENRYLQARQLSGTFALLAVSKVLFEVGLQIWFLLGLERGLAGLFEAVLISEALFTVVVSALVLPRIGFGFRPALLAPVLVYALPLIPNGLLQFCLHSADRYMLGWLRDEDAVGLYALAYKVGYLPNSFVLSPFLLIWYPYVFGQGTRDAQRSICGRVTSYFLLVVTAATLGVGLFAREMIVFLGRDPSYHAAAPAVLPIALGYWLWALFQFQQTGFYVEKKTRLLPGLTGAATALNFGLNVLWIPRHGILGAAWATTATFALLVLVTHTFGRRVFPVRYEWWRIFAPVIGALAVILCAERGPGAGTPAAKLAWAAVWLLWVVFGGGFLRPGERATVIGALIGSSKRP